MPALEEVAGEGPKGVPTDAPALELVSDGDVQARVAVVGGVLLPALDQADHRALHHDGEARPFLRQLEDVLPEPLFVIDAPPGPDRWLSQEVRHGGGVLEGDEAKLHGPTAQMPPLVLDGGLFRASLLGHGWVPPPSRAEEYGDLFPRS